ncbi:MAG: bifunctional hydroxymethylpyrimidine kinase/phosphomethylpyrimidine kinase [Acidothermus cellulolyticus]|nr:bifunctional hydroxymethylpyrimidine kinase/phosphomethylpyrimidine kinase [Acidothermus cellulolyticus]
MAARPRVLAIAGSDPSAGAGLQADLKTMFACGVYGMTVVTAVTAQNSRGVSAVWPVPPEAVAAQLDAVLGDIGVDAVKIGMLARADTVHVVADRLAGLDVPIIVDPVGFASHGEPLADTDARAVLRSRLLPLATLVTPNLAEAAELAGVTVHEETDLELAAWAMKTLGPEWVLVKGGHLAGDAVDALYDGVTVRFFRSPRIATAHTHGTGCTLASAIASYLARGYSVPDAVGRAKDAVTAAIAGGFPLGSGTGPVDHDRLLDFR